MIPILPELNTNENSTLEGRTFVDRTYKINIDRNIITGYVDGLEAVKQAVYLILNIERYKFPIYSWDYGVELIDLFGKPIPFIETEIKGRIDAALLMDNRIISTDNYVFERNRNKLHVTFDVFTNVGNFTAQMEVES